MGPIPKAVVFVLLFMSIYSIAVGIERLIVFYKAKKQSNILLRLIGKLWQEGKIEESIKVSSDKKFKNSHLAKVLVAGLNELEFQEDSNAPYAEKVESAKRAIERATIKGLVEFKRGLNGLATIGSTGPFVGLFGTVFGVITAFQGMAVAGSAGMGAVAGGIAEALITTGFGILVAVIAVMFFNFLLNKVDIFTGEMANASSELIDHYIKKRTGA
ncbi:MAG: flagellar motor protein MotA [Candidatus Aminicenantes bacterium]|nr:flagellar motor protein MotA [Candidatus Aminicenantes bacterium]NIM82783.1 flagellar motor protein MotA [Candidatus Aminicenantes bacterium]NIN22158.1 flagellar motor protein MotA [Candidatus Aminicenantes bacterium]NIN41155.1 flagellar motor protein MotA [Candidatus Aminicenantes bacterium]NIN88754.1 flagellar motor protein MotA [Candidatus Aminicenantes bacterium]